MCIMLCLDYMGTHGRALKSAFCVCAVERFRLQRPLSGIPSLSCGTYYREMQLNVIAYLSSKLPLKSGLDHIVLTEYPIYMLVIYVLKVLGTQQM